MMKKEMNEMIKLFNEKIENLEKKQKGDIENLERKQKEDIENLEKNHNNQIFNFIIEIEKLKTEIINLKSQNNYLKSEKDELKSRVEILESPTIFPLELVEGTDKSLFTLRNNLIEFNTNWKFLTVFLNKPMVEVFFFIF
jgi:predicted RNase H-like nuclease (RuvC/YqgF family)